MDWVLDRDGGDGERLCLRGRRVQRGTRARTLLLAGTALAGALILAPSLAQAQNATWTGSTSGDWNTNANWAPASVPTGTATFDATGLTQAVTVSADASIDTIALSAGAPTYSYTINPGVAFDIVGAGIVNNSANAPNFLNSGTLSFSNSSTAANANIINNSFLNFNNASSVGSASLVNNGFLGFSNTSTAATATILNNTTITFQDSSSAGSAVITNSGGASLISFADTSTAGSATITTNGGALTQFTGRGDGGSAQFITAAGGRVDFSGTTGAAGNNQVTAGSIAGAGTYQLGGNQLTVGSNNLSTTVSGAIEDGGTFGGTGASLVKVGSGVLTLSGTNTYTGATTVNAGTLIAASNGALPTTAVTVNTGATLTIADGVVADIGSLAGGGSVQIGTTDATTALFIGLVNPATTTFSGAITGPGSLELDGGQLTLTGAGNNIGGNLDLCACDVGGITIKGGAFVVGGNTSVAGGTLAVTNGGTLATGDLLVGTKMVIDGAGSTVTATGNTGIGLLGSGPLGAGALTISGGGVLNSQGPTEIDNFAGTPTVTVTGVASKWNVSGPMTVGNGTFGGPGTLTISNGGSVNATGAFMEIGDQADGSSLVTVTGAGSTLNVTNSLTLGHPCACTSGTLTIADGAVVNSPGFTGIGAGSTLNLGTGGLAGSIVTPVIVDDGRILANFTDALTLAAAISGTGTLTKAGSGTLTLSGTNTYTGATTINGGTLSVNGSITSAAAVNAGGTLAGTGTVADITVNAGGTLAPDPPAAPGTLTSTGSLLLNPGATYLVQVTPTAASTTNISNTATLTGATLAINATGAEYTLGTRYTVLTALSGLGGTTFANTTATSGPVKATISYDANDVFITLSQALLGSQLPPGLNANQTNVANAINNFINAGGTLPPAFQNLFYLSPSQLAQALTQLGGQNNAGGGQQSGFQMMNEFMLLMLNPFDADRGGFGGGGFGAGSAISRFAPERELPPEIARAYAAVTPPSERTIPFNARWNVWASAFGGANNTNGDPNGTGSANFAARTAGVAAGLDYRLSPDTLIGFALAGGGTSWSLAQGLGGGRSDVFQAGLYGSQKFGPWYVSGAVAFANYWASTTRTITLPAVDTLNAGFNAQSWGGRAEAGYRISWTPVNLAPYVALQAQTFSTPNYSETATSGSNTFALSYAAHTGSVVRSEIGSWASRTFLLADNALVTAFGRAAYAHDWQDTPQASATFLGLAPVASFITNGTKPTADLAVMTAGAEIRMANGWALMGKFDGEFGQGTQTYVGTGGVRFAW